MPHFRNFLFDLKLKAVQTDALGLGWLKTVGLGNLLWATSSQLPFNIVKSKSLCVCLCMCVCLSVIRMCTASLYILMNNLNVQISPTFPRAAFQSRVLAANKTTIEYLYWCHSKICHQAHKQIRHHKQKLFYKIRIYINLCKYLCSIKCKTHEGIIENRTKNRFQLGQLWTIGCKFSTHFTYLI